MNLAASHMFTQQLVTDLETGSRYVPVLLRMCNDVRVRK